jgi:hypothetical protein
MQIIQGGCCWEPGFKETIVEPSKSWVLDQDWTYVYLQSSRDYTELDVLFSSIPPFIGGEGIAMYRTVSDELQKNVYSRHFSVGHHGQSDVPYVFTTDQYNRSGGMAPVVVYSVPDYYMKHYTPTWENKFEFQSAIDFSKALYDPQGPVAENAALDPDFLTTHLKATPYYGDFEQARSQGFPKVPQDELPAGSPSDDDIDINLRLVHFSQLFMAGMVFVVHSTWLTRYASRLDLQLWIDYPRRKPSLEGLSYPIVFVQRSKYLANLQLVGDPVAKMVRTAGPAPGSSDPTIQAGFNRLYPLLDDPRISVFVNGNEFEAENNEWDDQDVSQRFARFLSWELVQDWSPPSSLQEGLMDGSGNPQNLQTTQ